MYAGCRACKGLLWVWHTGWSVHWTVQQVSNIPGIMQVFLWSYNAVILHCMPRTATGIQGFCYQSLCHLPYTRKFSQYEQMFLLQRSPQYTYCEHLHVLNQPYSLHTPSVCILYWVSSPLLCWRTLDGTKQTIQWQTGQLTEGTFPFSLEKACEALPRDASFFVKFWSTDCSWSIVSLQVWSVYMVVLLSGRTAHHHSGTLTPALLIQVFLVPQHVLMMDCTRCGIKWWWWYNYAVNFTLRTH